MWSWLAVVLATASVATAVPRWQRNELAGTCAFQTQPTERDLGNGFRSWIWSEPYSAELFQDGNWQGGERYEAYTSWLNKTIPRDFGGLDPFDQRACLKHQRDIFKSVGYSTHDWDVILNGTVGGLYQMNCIESLLWGKQNEYHPQKESATEFGAYILLDATNTSVKIYLQTGPTLSVPGMSWVDNLIEQDLEDGYHLQTFLHLHPFDASNIKYQDCAGTCIPSSPDLAAFKVDLNRFNAAQAWITNGADSFRFGLDQLDLFNGDGEETRTRPEIYYGA